SLSRERAAAKSGCILVGCGAFSRSQTATIIGIMPLAFSCSATQIRRSVSPLILVTHHPLTGQPGPVVVVSGGLRRPRIGEQRPGNHAVELQPGRLVVEDGQRVGRVLVVGVPAPELAG